MNKYIIDSVGGRVAKEAILRTTLGLQNVRVVSAYNNPYEGRPELAARQVDEKLGVSSLGTPVFCDLTLLGGQYSDNSGRVIELPNDRYRSNPNQSTAGNDSGIGVSFYMNLETVLLTVNQPIRVIKTEIQGRDGTVKEYIGKADANITINGILTGKNGVHPKEEVNRLRRWLEAPISKGVVSWWLDNLGISDIVVEDFTFPQTMGGYSYQAFSIQAVSDVPVELKITQPIK